MIHVFWDYLDCQKNMNMDEIVKPDILRSHYLSRLKSVVSQEEPFGMQLEGWLLDFYIPGVNVKLGHLRF